MSKVNKFINQYFGEEILPLNSTFDHRGLTFTHDRLSPVIWLPKIPDTASEFGVMTHEILHAVFALSLIIGFKPSRKSEEFFTYLQGFLTEQILIKIGKIKSNEKRKRKRKI